MFRWGYAAIVALLLGAGVLGIFLSTGKADVQVYKDWATADFSKLADHPTQAENASAGSDKNLQLSRVPEAPPPTGLLSEYRGMHDGRVFVLRALQRPELGGNFYASSVIDKCIAARGLTSAVNLGQPEGQTSNPTRAQQASDIIHARCGQFSEAELEHYSSQKLAKIKGDKLFDIISGFKTGHQSLEERRAALTSILLEKDPLLLDAFRERLLVNSDKNGGYVYFDGKRYPLLDAAPIIAALYLLPCGLGLPCDSADMEISMQCVNGGACYQSRFERARAEFGGLTDNNYEQVINFYELMLHSIQRGDLARFLEKNNAAK